MSCEHSRIDAPPGRTSGSRDRKIVRRRRLVAGLLVAVLVAGGCRRRDRTRHRRRLPRRARASCGDPGRRRARVRRLAGRGPRACRRPRAQPRALRQEPGRRLRDRRAHGVLPAARRGRSGGQRIRRRPRRGDRLPRERRPAGGHRGGRSGGGVRPHPDPRRDRAELPRHERRPGGEPQADGGDRGRRAARRPVRGGAASSGSGAWSTRASTPSRRSRERFAT